MNKLQHENIDPVVAAQLCRQIERNLAKMTVEVLAEAKRRQDIERHNALVDAKRRAKGKQQ